MSAANNQNQGGYPQNGNPQGGYPPPLGYPGKPGYPPHLGYPPHPGYPWKFAYPPQPGFASQPCYPPEPSNPPGKQENQAGHDFEPVGQSQPEAVDLGEVKIEALGEVKESAFKEQSIRRSFIRKVFFSLMCQLLIAMGFVTLCHFHDGTNYWFYFHPWLIWVALGIMLVTMVEMACCSNVRRRAPMNFICLGIFTVTETFLLGVIAVRAPVAVMMAVGVTAAVCLALTIFALQTKWDFTMKIGFPMCGTVVLLLLGIAGFFLQNHIVHLVYASFAALIFSMYLVYDILVMMGGEYKYSISPEEYIFAALNLYLDFANIFVHIISAVSSMRGK